MIVTIMFVAVAVAFAVFLMHSLQRQRVSIKSIDDLPRHTSPVHIPALLNLLDKEQEQFLRDRLSYSQFQELERKRIRAVWKYFDTIATNAAALQSVGDAARHSADPEIATAGKDLATIALWTRIYVFLDIVQLLGGLLLLQCPSHVRHAIDRYTAVVAHAERLVGHQYPDRVKLICARL